MLNFVIRKFGFLTFFAYLCRVRVQVVWNSRIQYFSKLKTRHMNQRIYAASQLIAALPPTALKVLMWMLGWQNQPTITIYVHQYSRALKISEEEVEVAIQTLIDKNLISVSNVDNKWRAELNAEQFKKYYDVPIQKVIDSDGIKLSEKVTWNVQDEPFLEKALEGEMSEQQLQSMILRLQAQLNEKKQVRSMVRSASVNETDLPF